MIPSDDKIRSLEIRIPVDKERIENKPDLSIGKLNAILTKYYDGQKILNVHVSENHEHVLGGKEDKGLVLCLYVLDTEGKLK